VLAEDLSESPPRPDAKRDDCCDACRKEDRCLTTYDRCIMCHSPPQPCSACSVCDLYSDKSFVPAIDLIRQQNHKRLKQQHIAPVKGRRK